MLLIGAAALALMIANSAWAASYFQLLHAQVAGLDVLHWVNDDAGEQAERVEIKAGWADLPVAASWPQLFGVSLLCGIGFTMSLFIGLLAFPTPALQDQVKVGVLVGSLASALCGLALLAVTKREPPKV